MARKGIYVTPQGVSPQCSGLEIKESKSEAQKKEERGLRGFFVEGAGFERDARTALARATTLALLNHYKTRVWMREGR